ncbi:LysR substrate binding domain protein [compost metagenome]
MVQDDLAAGRLVSILPAYRSSSVGLYMYYPHRTHVPARVRRFIDFVMAASPETLPALAGGEGKGG